MLAYNWPKGWTELAVIFYQKWIFFNRNFFQKSMGTPDT